MSDNKIIMSPLGFLERYETKVIRTFFAVFAFNSTASPHRKSSKEHHQGIDNKIRMSVSVLRFLPKTAQFFLNFTLKVIFAPFFEISTFNPTESPHRKLRK